MKKIGLVVLCACISAPGLAQSASEAPSAVATPVATEAPLQVAAPMPANTAILPANTQITMSMNDTITTKGKKFNEGDTFDLSVTHDVMLGQYVIHQVPLVDTIARAAQREGTGLLQSAIFSSSKSA